jgi:DNA-binding NtrC family response regulator
MPAAEAQGSSRVLIVDDDADMRDALGTFLSAQGHVCELVADGATALALLDRVKRTRPALAFVVLTAMGDVQDAVTAIKRGAFQ